MTLIFVPINIILSEKLRVKVYFVSAMGFVGGSGATPGGE
uniref:Uncharacterized protein n=1 Tax=Arundo donax TaxID=35708 RepID=A0A0A9FV49_ARUDO